MELTETNNAKSVSTNPCATESGIFQLFWTCDLLPFLHLHMRKGVRSELLKSARLVCLRWWIRMKVTSEEVDTDHVGQPVGPSVKVEDQTQCCVGHLKVATWLRLDFLKVMLGIIFLNLTHLLHTIAWHVTHSNTHFPGSLVDSMSRSQGFQWNRWHNY